ncbi:MAG: hypothetical protein H6621_12710 [Halobacteriovoraceae bacterium]|nr:hypothetical protein [Halobacteriovoraceae bacterium]MCB9095922.1 hypothetical protein [Halobacteriovoraceae bacterium]
MKKLLVLIFLSGILVHANEENKEMTDAQKEEEFNKKVNERVLKEVDRIKKKSVAELTREILKREKELDQREETIKQREEKLNNSVQDFERKIAEFEQRQSNFIACIDKNNQERDQRVKQMVEVIANMKPAKAADLITVQDSDIAVKILSKLDTTKASKIFNLLSKEKSAELQKLFLNMKK